MVLKEMALGSKWDILCIRGGKKMIEIQKNNNDIILYFQSAIFLRHFISMLTHLFL